MALQVDLGVLRQASAVNVLFVSALAQYAACTAVDQIEWHSSLTVDDWRGSAANQMGGFFASKNKSDHSRSSCRREPGVEVFGVDGLDDKSNLGGLACVAIVRHVLVSHVAGDFEGRQRRNKTIKDGNLDNSRGCGDYNKQRYLLKKGRAGKRRRLFGGFRC